MELSEFLDHIKFFNTKLIEDFLSNQLIEQNSIQEEYLNALSPDLFYQFKNSLQEELIQNLNNNKMHERVIQLTASVESAKLNYEIAHLRIQSLWEVGQLSKYFEETKFLIEYLLVNKAYAGLEKIFTKEKNRIEKKDFYILSYVQANIELNNIINILTILKNLREKYINEELENYTLFQRIYTLLELNEVVDYRLRKERLLFKIILMIKGKVSLLEKELIETLLYCENKLEYLLLSHCVSEFTYEHFSQFLKSDLKVGVRDIPKILKDSHVKQTFFKKVKPTIEEKSFIEKEEPVKDYSNLKVNLDSVDKTSQTIVYYNKTEDEDRVLRFIQIVDDKKFFTEEMAITFLEMKYFTTAEYIIRKLETTSNKFYLQAIVNMKLKNFSGAIMSVNYALENFMIEAEDKIPFEVIKAVAFKSLGEIKEFERLKKQILAIDPDINLNGKMWQL